MIGLRWGCGRPWGHWSERYWILNAPLHWCLIVCLYGKQCRSLWDFSLNDSIFLFSFSQIVTARTKSCWNFGPVQNGFPFAGWLSGKGGGYQQFHGLRMLWQLPFQGQLSWLWDGRFRFQTSRFPQILRHFITKPCRRQTWNPALHRALHKDGRALGEGGEAHGMEAWQQSWCHLVSSVFPRQSTYGFQKLACEYFAKGAWEQHQPLAFEKKTNGKKTSGFLTS